MQWLDILGADKVAHDDATIDRYSRTTSPHGTRPLCVLYPTSTEDVQAAVRVANEAGVVVYPISRGRNWGYGDACAPTDGAAILDLSRMNRILEVNRELAYAVIEPGVSQRQLHEYLRERKTGLWMDCTGAGLEASMVGNTLDRGFGHTRYGDRFATTCGMEIVLADGRVLRTGYGHFAGARAQHVYRYGAGPFVDGLFSQSNLGIVTRVGLWLMPEPEEFCFFYVRVPRHEDLAPLIDQLRPLRMKGVLTTAVHIGNDLRILSSKMRYPWDEAGGRTPMPPELRDQLRKREGLGAWNVGSAITGTKAQVRDAKRAIRRAVGSLGKVGFVNDRILWAGERVVGMLQKVGLGHGLAGNLRALKPVYAQLRGEPTDEPLGGLFWRLRSPFDPNDPLASGAGLMWISPVLPMTGCDAETVLQIVEPLFNRFGFDVMVTFTMINERAMIGILNVAYDKGDAAEVDRATACYDAMAQSLMSAGYPPYRTSPQGMAKLHSGDDVFWDVARAIKEALDPNDIIARGRYIPPLENVPRLQSE